MRRRFRFLVVSLVASLLMAGAIQSVHALHLRAYRSVEPICRVQTSRQMVALSFDDGPDPRYTPAVLRLLSAQGYRATFFVVGERAALHQRLIGEILSSGNDLGNHTWSHARLSELPEATAVEEIRRTQDVLASEEGAALVRAPFGEVGADTLSELWDAGLTPIHWSIPLDHYVGGLGLEPEEAAARIADEVEAGDIILAHDAGAGGIGRERAMRALRILLPLLDARGFEVTTVSDLLHSGVAVRAVARSWVWQSGFTCPDP